MSIGTSTTRVARYGGRIRQARRLANSLVAAHSELARARDERHEPTTRKPARTKKPSTPKRKVPAHHQRGLMSPQLSPLRDESSRIAW